MKETYILAIDQGTTSTRSIIFNRKGQIMASSQMEIAQICPNNGWVEQNPEEIFETVIQTIKDALNQAHLSIESIEALGITTKGKQPFSGIKLPESRFIMPSSGNRGNRRRFARSGLARYQKPSTKNRLDD